LILSLLAVRVMPPGLVHEVRRGLLLFSGIDAQVTFLARGTPVGDLELFPGFFIPGFGALYVGLFLRWAQVCFDSSQADLEHICNALTSGLLERLQFVMQILTNPRRHGGVGCFIPQPRGWDSTTPSLPGYHILHHTVYQRGLPL